MKTKRSLTTSPMNRSELRRALLSMELVLSCFGRSPTARAVCKEGCDTSKAKTFLGENALLNKFGASNTIVGWTALISNVNAS